MSIRAVALSQASRTLALFPSELWKHIWPSQNWRAGWKPQAYLCGLDLSIRDSVLQGSVGEAVQPSILNRLLRKLIPKQFWRTDKQAPCSHPIVWSLSRTVTLSRAVAGLWNRGPLLGVRHQEPQQGGWEERGGHRDNLLCGTTLLSRMVYGKMT